MEIIPKIIILPVNVLLLNNTSYTLTKHGKWPAIQEGYSNISLCLKFWTELKMYFNIHFVSSFIYLSITFNSLHSDAICKAWPSPSWYQWTCSPHLVRSWEPWDSESLYYWRSCQNTPEMASAPGGEIWRSFLITGDCLLRIWGTMYEQKKVLFHFLTPFVYLV